MISRPIRIRVIYKNGVVLDTRCADLKTKRNGLGELVGIDWIDAMPRPIEANLDEIAAIWRLK